MKYSVSLSLSRAKHAKAVAPFTLYTMFQNLQMSKDDCVSTPLTTSHWAWRSSPIPFIQWQIVSEKYMQQNVPAEKLVLWLSFPFEINFN